MGILSHQRQDMDLRGSILYFYLSYAMGMYNVL